MTPIPRKIKRYGWRPGLVHFESKVKYSDVVPVGVLPASVDLRQTLKMPPVYDQGDLGSCTANALAAAIEIEMMKQGEPDFMPSRLYIYYNERALEGDPQTDSGAAISDGVSVLHSEGVCPESEWPYDVTQFSVKPTPQCYIDGMKHTAIEFARVANQIIPSVMKLCLYNGNPFVFGFTVYESFESSAVTATGIVPMPQSGEQIIGGHAVLCVGYDDSREAFLCRNSWGTGWGDQGYFWIPYKYLTDATLASDFWCISKVS